jgi:hypothetical protein
MKGKDLDPEFRGNGSSKKLDVPIAPAGNQLGRIYGVAHLGPIHDDRYNKLKNEFVILVELLFEKAVSLKVAMSFLMVLASVTTLSVVKNQTWQLLLLR